MKINVSTQPIPNISSTLIRWPSAVPRDGDNDVPVKVRFAPGLTLPSGNPVPDLMLAQLRPTSQNCGLLLVYQDLADEAIEVVPVTEAEQQTLRHAAFIRMAASPVGRMFDEALIGGSWPEELGKIIPQLGSIFERAKHEGQLWIDPSSIQFGPVICSLRLHGLGFAGELVARSSALVYGEAVWEVSVAVLRNAHEVSTLPQTQAQLNEHLTSAAPLPQRVVMFGQTLPTPVRSKHLPCTVGVFEAPLGLLDTPQPIPGWALASKDGGMTGGTGICPLGTWEGAPADLDSAAEWLRLKGTRAVFYLGRGLDGLRPPIDLRGAYTFSDLDQGNRVHGWRQKPQPKQGLDTPWLSAGMKGPGQEWEPVEHCPPGLQWIVRTYGMLAHLAESGYYPASEALFALEQTLDCAIDTYEEPLGRGVGWLLGLHGASRHLGSQGMSIAYRLLDRISGKVNSNFLHAELGHKDCDLFAASKLTHSIASPWEAAIVLLGVSAMLRSHGGIEDIPKHRNCTDAVKACLRAITFSWSNLDHPGDVQPDIGFGGQPTWAYKLLVLGDQVKGRYFGEPKGKANRDAELYMPAALAEGLSLLRVSGVAFGELEFQAVSQLENFLMRAGGAHLGLDLVARADAYFQASRGKAQHGWALVCAMAVRRLMGAA